MTKHARWRATQVVFPDGPTWHIRAGGLEFDVEVVPGPGRLLRLERTVRERLRLSMCAPPVPPLWRVDERTHAHGDLYELEEDTIWTVVDVVADKPLWEFRGGSSSTLGAGTWNSSGGSHGCDEVVLGADGLCVLTRDSNKVACHQMPESDESLTARVRTLLAQTLLERWRDREACALVTAALEAGMKQAERTMLRGLLPGGGEAALYAAMALATVGDASGLAVLREPNDFFCSASNVEVGMAQCARLALGDLKPPLAFINAMLLGPLAEAVGAWPPTPAGEAHRNS